jgi:hypothetical protein
MARLKLLAAATVALAALSSPFGVVAVPAAAQEWSDRGGAFDDGDLRGGDLRAGDLRAGDLRDEVLRDEDLRDILAEFFRPRRDAILNLRDARRDRSNELIAALMDDRFDDLSDDPMMGFIGKRRGRLPTGIAAGRGEDRNCYAFNGRLGGETRGFFIAVSGRFCRG